MLQNPHTNKQNRKSKPPRWLATNVQCVPGGHQIPISEAYWCSDCGWNICYKHLKRATFTTAIHCPKGHAVSKVT